MCATCGCGEAAGHGEHEHEHEHVMADGSVVRHRHGHDGDGHGHGLGLGHAAEARRVRVERDLLAKNDEVARANRAGFEKSGALVVNVMSSPGSGKTTLLCALLGRMKGRVGVIEGDQQTTLDADRIRATGAPAVQINTGKGCHLDAAMVRDALPRLGAVETVFVENVGNLVCPAGFDLGEAARAVVVSVTEGEDKPLKYPDMFASADIVIVNKCDLLPHLAFDLAALRRNIERMRPGVAIVETSATTGAGLDALVDWMEARRRAARAHG